MKKMIFIALFTMAVGASAVYGQKQNQPFETHLVKLAAEDASN